MGWLIILIWLAFATIMVVLGKLCECEPVVIVGSALVLVLAAVVGM